MRYLGIDPFVYCLYQKYYYFCLDLVSLCCSIFHCICFMILVVIGEKEGRLVNIRCLIPVVLRPLFEQKVLPFCIPRDRWDKEFYNLQGG